MRNRELEGRVILNEKQAAALLGVTPGALKTWRHSPPSDGGPPYIKYGTANRSPVRYLKSELLAYMERCRMLTAQQVAEKTNKKEKTQLDLLGEQECLDKLLSTAEAAEYLGMKRKALSRMREKGKGPSYLKLGNSQVSPVRYRISDLESWLDAATVNDDGPVPVPVPAPAQRQSTPKKQIYEAEPEKMTIYLPPELAKALRIKAATNRSSISFVVQNLLQSYLSLK